jgi:hypothetical protein
LRDAAMTELLVAMGLVAGVVAAHEIGFRLGLLARSAASTAALVAFLIGFAFSRAASRLIDRQDIIVKEANALGTAYLRADTIAEQRGDLKAALKEYTADRVTMLNREGRDQIEPLLAKVSNMHKRMWRSAINATQDNAPLMAVILSPINEVINLHSTHVAMARRHLPIPIMTVLFGAAAVGVGIIGFGNGRVGRRFSVLDAVYGVVLAAALWMTVDLDYPGIGVIRSSNLLVAETLVTMI